MEKLVYLLQSEPAGVAHWPELAGQLCAIGASGLVVNHRDADQWQAVMQRNPARIAGSWGQLEGMLEFWLDCVDDRMPVEALLREAGYRLAGYLVTESLVQRPEGSWPVDGRRPGVSQFTAHGKPEGLGESEFFRNWEAHSALSFALHPYRWSYVRNAVARVLTEGAPPYRSIVLEHFHTLDDFTDESRYFGDPAVVREMYAELAGFCDVNSMITGPMTEYRFGG